MIPSVKVPIFFFNSFFFLCAIDSSVRQERDFEVLCSKSKHSHLLSGLKTSLRLKYAETNLTCGRQKLSHVGGNRDGAAGIYVC